MTLEQKEICRTHPYEKLYEELEKGSYESLVTFIRCSDFHGGGDLEDLHTLSGFFLLKDAFLYVYILEQEKVRESCLAPYFTMLNPNLVDDAEGQITEIHKRISVLQTLQSSRIRDYGLQELQEYLEFLEGTKNK